MNEVSVRINWLFRQTGLADEEFSLGENPMLTWCDRLHFYHVLLSVPENSLEEPFLSMQRDLPLMDPEQLAIEKPIADLADRMVKEILAWATHAGVELPYSNPDMLWRRIAFAAMTFAQMEGKEVIMMNLMILKVAQMVIKPGGLRNLENFVLSHGFVYALGECSPRF